MTSSQEPACAYHGDEHMDKDGCDACADDDVQALRMFRAYVEAIRVGRGVVQARTEIQQFARKIAGTKPRMKR